MNADIHLEHRAGSSQDKHEGEPSLGLCDRLDRTRDNSQRQLPTDHDYAVPTREYQTDQSSLKTAPTAARSAFGKRKRKPPKQSHRSRPVDTVTPYQGLSTHRGRSCLGHSLSQKSPSFLHPVRRTQPTRQAIVKKAGVGHSKSFASCPFQWIWNVITHQQCSARPIHDLIRKLSCCSKQGI
jgi:hypothetical protein